MNTVKQPHGQHPHTLALLDRAFRGLKKSLERVTPLGPGLRPSHFRLLGYITPDGVRLTDLAHRAGMTKQALGEFVATLQDGGYVEVTTDPRDRRSKQVRPTLAGEKIRVALDELVVEAERDWEAKVGKERWATFQAVLREMAEGH